MKRQKLPTHWNDISITINGVEVTGSYSVDNADGMTVRIDGGGSKFARAGRAAESVARLMLGELYREGRQGSAT